MCSSQHSMHSPVLGAGCRQQPIAHRMDLNHPATGRPGEGHRVGEGRCQQVGLRWGGRRLRRRRHCLLLLLLLRLLGRVVSLLLVVVLLLHSLLRLRCCAWRGLRLLWGQHVGCGRAASGHQASDAKPAP